jgi:pyruvate kinase
VKIQILCTLGPASLDPVTIRRLGAAGVDLFRINLSHTAIKDLEQTIALVQASSDVPVCLDTEGPQVRNGLMADDVTVAAGDVVVLTSDEVTGTAERMSLRPREVFASLCPGTRMTIDFDGAALEVLRTNRGTATAVVLEGGRVRSNKAVLLDGALALPTLSSKDLEAVEIGVRRGIRNFAVSFARSADDVARMRSLIPSGSSVIAKIESRAGVNNMDGIIEAADAVLIDRGDLSLEIPLEEVPFYQKALIRRTNLWSKPVYVATNLLESMIVNRRPTVAEANDIANTLLDGVHGLVLAAETAVGIDPVGSVEMITRMLQAFRAAHHLPALETAGIPALAGRA